MKKGLPRVAKKSHFFNTFTSRLCPHTSRLCPHTSTLCPHENRTNPMSI